MDYGLLNVFGIGIMMVFGLWAYQRGYKKCNKKNEESSENKTKLIKNYKDFNK